MAGPDIRQCKDCGKLFQFYNSPFCRECLEKFDDYYVKVRDYIYDNPSADILKISEGSGVDEKYIRQFLREGRLQLVGAVDGGLTCVGCGARIAGGEYCEACKAKMSQQFGDMARRDAPPPPPKKDLTSRPSQKMHVDLRRDK